MKLRIAQPLLGRLATWVAAQPEPQPTRPEAVRRMLQNAIAATGPIAPGDAGTALTHEIKALEQDLASIPTGADQTPESALHTMDRALAENELAVLRQRRKRLRKAP